LHGSPPARVERTLKNVLVSLLASRLVVGGAHRRARTRSTTRRAFTGLASSETRPRRVSDTGRPRIQISHNPRRVTQSSPGLHVPFNAHLRHYPFTPSPSNSVPRAPAPNGLRRRAPPHPPCSRAHSRAPRPYPSPRDSQGRKSR